MRNFIILTDADSCGKISLDINNIDIMSEESCGWGKRLTKVSYGHKGDYINVKEPVQEIVKRINEVNNNEKIESGTKATDWTPSPDSLSGIELIRAERERQVNELEYDDENDDCYTSGELSVLAEKYILGGMAKKYTTEERIVELSKAGALIAAEIDRLQRLK